MAFKHSYKIQFYVKTLNENYVNVTDKKGFYRYPGFNLGGVHFEPYDFNLADGHKGQSWIASAQVNADSGQKAVRKARNKLEKVTEIVSFVGEAYIEVDQMPFLAIRNDGIAFFRYIFEEDPVPLMFMDDDLKILKVLLKDKTIPRAFYKFWNQAVNTSNYFGKLAMMFSAIDSFKLPNGKVDTAMREMIFGKRLSRRLYQNNNKGLRHRLIHGLALKENEEKLYWLLIHRAVAEWMNKGVLVNSPLALGVVGPQRNFDGNKMGSWLLLKQRSEEYPLEIRRVLSCCDKDETQKLLEEYEWVYENPTINEFWES